MPPIITTVRILYADGTIEVRQYVGGTPREACIAAYANLQGDTYAAEYEARYADLVIMRDDLITTPRYMIDGKDVFVWAKEERR